MTALAGPLIGMGASALGGLFGSKDTKTSSQSTTTQSGTNTNNQLNQAIEDPQFAAFRDSLIPAFQQQYQDLQKPVYGDAQKSSYLSSLNDLAQGSVQSLKSTLGARGALDSGAFNQGASNIEQSRLGKASDFFGQIPAMEAQRKQTGLQNLLGLGTQFAGRAPISQQLTGTQTNNSTSTTNGTQTQSGPGAGSRIGAGLAGFGGDMYANWQNGGGSFGGSQPDYASQSPVYYGSSYGTQNSGW